jgi:26S proteasome regulatory subunit N2
VQQPTGGVVVVLDKRSGEPRATIELRASAEAKPTAASETHTNRTPAGTATGLGASTQTPVRPTTGALTGAAVAAGVLTAVDEDEDDEGRQDAPVPDEFGYESDHVTGE